MSPGSCMRVVWAGLWCASALTAAGRPVQAQATQPSTAQQAAGDTTDYDRARELFGQATEAYQRADYRGARELFGRAHALEPGAATLRALGFCDYQLKQYAAAISELRAALAETRSHKTLSAEQQSAVQGVIKKIAPFVGRVVVETDPKQVTLAVDGKPITDREVYLTTGEHLLTASAPNYQEHTIKLTVTPGGDQHAWLELSPLRREPQVAASPRAVNGTPDPTLTARQANSERAHAADAQSDSGSSDPAAAGRVRGIIGLALGGAALVTGAVTGSLSIMKTHDEKHHCFEGHCPLESARALSTANTLANVANITLIVGAVGVGYGLYELLTLPSAAPGALSRRGVQVAFTGTGVALRGAL